MAGRDGKKRGAGKVTCAYNMEREGKIGNSEPECYLCGKKKNYKKFIDCNGHPHPWCAECRYKMGPVYFSPEDRK
jgi:hypothetical protein